MEKIYHVNKNHRKAAVTKSILGNADFRTKNITREKEDYFKVISSRGPTILNVYTLSVRISKHIMLKLIELKRGKEKFTVLEISVLLS